eukprot:gene5449-10948_t
MGSGSSVLLPDTISPSYAAKCTTSKSSQQLVSKLADKSLTKEAFMQRIVLENESIITDIMYSYIKSDLLEANDFLRFCSDHNLIDSEIFSTSKANELFISNQSNGCISSSIFQNELLSNIALCKGSSTELLKFIMLRDHISKHNEPTLQKTMPSFPKVGVRLNALDEFIELCGGRDALQGFTTTEICNNFIKPLTHTRKCSYCDILSEENNPNVLDATVFISHAWEFQFLDVVDTILHHFLNNSNVVIWFDLFSNNQHVTDDLDFHWWSSTFKTAIEQMGHTVLIFHSWDDLKPLKRSWCLFEIYCSIINPNSNSKFEIAMNGNEEKSFISGIEDNYPSINSKISQIDLQESITCIPDDKQKIFDAVIQIITFKELNFLILSKLKIWLRELIEKAIKTASDKEETLRLQSALGVILRDQKLLLDAEITIRGCYEGYRDLLGDNHPSTMAAMSSLAQLYHDQGKYAESESLFKRCMELWVLEAAVYE